MLKVEPTGPTEAYTEAMNLLNQIVETNMRVLAILEILHHPQYLIDKQDVTDDLMQKFAEANGFSKP